MNDLNKAKRTAHHMVILGAVLWAGIILVIMHQMSAPADHVAGAEAVVGGVEE